MRPRNPLGVEDGEHVFAHAGRRVGLEGRRAVALAVAAKVERENGEVVL